VVSLPCGSGERDRVPGRDLTDLHCVNLLAFSPVLEVLIRCFPTRGTSKRGKCSVALPRPDGRRLEALVEGRLGPCLSLTWGQRTSKGTQRWTVPLSTTSTTEPGTVFNWFGSFVVPAGVGGT